MNFWPRGPRPKPYTNSAIEKLKCVRCGSPGHMTFQLCADNRQYRILCKTCSLGLKVFVLEWMNTELTKKKRKDQECIRCNSFADNLWEFKGGCVLLCDTCDVIINKMVLEWANHPYAEMLGNTYEEKVRRTVDNP